jgi:hypothetical protein
MQGFMAIFFHDMESLGEVAIFDGGSTFQGTFEVLKQLFGIFDGVGLAFQFNPAFPGGRFDLQLLLEGLQVAGIIVEELLRQAGVFEVKSFRRH